MKALSIRQPWAWAILHAGKDLENRSQFALSKMNISGIGRLGIHAAKGMTRGEWEWARDFMAKIGIACPLAADLLRGGVIGTVEVVGIVKQSQSAWFFGPRAIRLKNPEPIPFIGGPGQLGIFDFPDYSLPVRDPEPPLPWMLKQKAAISPPAPASEAGLFAGARP